MRTFFRNVLQRRSVERELDDELRASLDVLVARKVASGTSATEARRQAAIELGFTESVKDAVRDARAGAFVEVLVQDLRYGTRVLRRSPGYTLTAIVMLALGVGANTAVFTLADHVMLRPLPVAQPQELAAIDLVTVHGEVQNISYPLFERLRLERGPFARMFAVSDGADRMPVTGPEPGAAAEEATVHLVSGEYFETLGVRPVAGRLFDGRDEAPGAAGVAVISDRYWQRRFARDPRVLGISIAIKRQNLAIVGVAPPEFFGEVVGTAPDVWVPLTMQPRMSPTSPFLARENVGWLRVMGRLAPGMTQGQAEAALAVALASVKAEGTPLGTFAHFIKELRVSDGSRGLSDLRTRFGAALWILGAIVAVVLLIACANVMNLQLAMASVRRRELGIRLAIGAGRARVVRQLITESLLLAFAGSVVAVFVAWWGSQVMLVLASTDRSTVSIDVSPDLRILAFTLGLALASVAIFGVVPALLVSRSDPGLALKSTSAPATRSTLARGLVVAEVALSLVLVTGAALLIRTLDNLRTRDLGFVATSLLDVRVRPAPGGPRPDQTVRSQRILAALSALPGVQAATVAHAGVDGGIPRTCCLAVEGYTHAPNEDRNARTMGVAPEYFGTLRIPIVRGRGFGAGDAIADPRASPPIAIVNEAFVRKYLGGRDPIGARLGFGNPPTVKYGVEIVGVAADAVYGDLRADSRPLIYGPFLWGNTYLIRFAGAPEAMATAIRREMNAIDPTLEPQIELVSVALERAVHRERLLSSLSSCFGVVALTLASVGLYGVMAFTVVRRRREIGLRMALGASRGAVLRGELRSALLLVAFGVVLGVPASLAAGYAMRTELFGVSPDDPAALVVAVALMGLVAAAAAYLPARRASHIDPNIALRCE